MIPAIVVLVVINFPMFNSSTTIITMQEFNSMKQCQYVAQLIKNKGVVTNAFCVNK